MQQGRKIIAYRLKLIALSGRFSAGQRSTVQAEAQNCADAMECLMEEAPLEKREAIDYLVDPNVTSESNVAVAYNNRCYAYMELGDLERALDDCTQSLRYGSLPDALRKQRELVTLLGRDQITSPDNSKTPHAKH